MKEFLKFIFRPYEQQGINRWFYFFGMNDRENNFVYAFSSFKKSYKFRNKYGQMDYVEYATTLDQVIQKIKRAFANNWYFCPSYFIADKYSVDTFGGSFWTYVDIDFKHYVDVNNLWQVKQFINKYITKIVVKCKPDAVVFSGGGFHIYKMSDVMLKDKKEWLEKERILVDCVKEIGLEPDPKVSANHINILRIPNTINLRYIDNGKHRFVDLIYLRSSILAH